MANWIFTQVGASVAGVRESKWVWELQDSQGEVIKRSVIGFSDLMHCIDDASRSGYYGGHPSVYFSTAEATS